MKNTLDKSDLEHLKSLVQGNCWIEDPEVLQSYLTEWRGLFTGQTQLMLMPENTAEVSSILAYCFEHEIAVVPQGGNTGLVGGGIPGLNSNRPEILLSSRRLNKIHNIDADNFTLTVGAGCILADVQKAAAEVQCVFPLSLAAEGTCHIGGNLATNAGGINVLRYGNTRDLMLGLEVVLPDGRVYKNLSGLRKDNTGYSLDHLFIGSEGTLGFITAATVKLFPEPLGVATAWIAIDSPKDALKLLGSARKRLGDELVAFELIPKIAIDLVLKHISSHRDPLDTEYPWYVLLEMANSCEALQTEASLTAFLTEFLDGGLIKDAVLATNISQRNAFWSIRHDISLAQKSAGASIKHDISLPISKLPEFVKRADLLVEQEIPGSRPVAFGHLGDGNLHYNVSQPKDIPADVFLDHWSNLNRLIHSLAAELGGSFSAEHGIGVLKLDELERFTDATKLSVMQDIKMLLDPKNIMNPGKILHVKSD
ncbi:MAG: FAD-binding oxidoreductase [Pseudomonadota bacterium]|nr:FAD-binding oxidoreductase [Pseudomonadota bacterium]